MYVEPDKPCFPGKSSSDKIMHNIMHFGCVRSIKGIVNKSIFKKMTKIYADLGETVSIF